MFVVNVIIYRVSHFLYLHHNILYKFKEKNYVPTAIENLYYTFQCRSGNIRIVQKWSAKFKTGDLSFRGRAPRYKFIVKQYHGKV